jgi:hypothetical protein
MNRSALINVDSLNASQRQAIESAVGSTLEQDEQIYIVVCRPDFSGPDEEIRRRARASLQAIFAKGDANLAATGVSDEEADAALEEALQHVRGERST